MGLINADSRILKDPAPFIGLVNLGDSSVDLTVRVWCESAEYWNVFFSMNEKVYKTFTEKGINIPFPQMDVHIVK
jgi:small conductance mechanosensitive channel